MKPEFSKKLLTDAKWLFVSQLIAGIVCAFLGKDTTIFCYTVPAAGAVYATAAGFYYNKAKFENICKGKIGFLKFKIRMMDIVSEEAMQEIANELDPLEEALTAKVNSAAEEAVQEDITINNL